MIATLAFALRVTLVADVGVTASLETLNNFEPVEYSGILPDADIEYVPPDMTAEGFPVSDMGTPLIVGVRPAEDITLG